MPNRVIRDSILTSRQVGQLDWFQQAPAGPADSELR